jgi:hypothetical protein
LLLFELLTATKSPGLALALFLIEYIWLSVLVVLTFGLLLYCCDSSAVSLVPYLTASILKLFSSVNLSDVVKLDSWENFLNTCGSILSYFFLIIALMAFSSIASYRSIELHEKVRRIVLGELDSLEKKETVPQTSDF